MPSTALQTGACAWCSWEQPPGDDSSSLWQRQDGQMQRFIREVNTTNRACVLWDLAEDADYIIQVQSIGLYGESQASKRVHFRTLKDTDRLPSNSSNQGEAAPSSSPKSRWWGHTWRSPQHTARDPAASEEGAALCSRLLGTHRVIAGSRVVQAAVVSTTATIMSPSPSLQPSYSRSWHPIQLSRLWPGQLQWPAQLLPIGSKY